jgi:hypothetical protein
MSGASRGLAAVGVRAGDGIDCKSNERRPEMARDQLLNEYREGRLDRPTFLRKLGAIGFSVTGALALAAALAPVAQAGVEAQHNETLVV